jgi:hypothetical protein
MDFAPTNGPNAMANLGRLRFRLRAAMVAFAMPFQVIPLSGEQVRVRHMEGLMHGFLPCVLPMASALPTVR